MLCLQVTVAWLGPLIEQILAVIEQENWLNALISWIHVICLVLLGFLFGFGFFFSRPITAAKMVESDTSTFLARLRKFVSESRPTPTQSPAE